MKYIQKITKWWNGLFLPWWAKSKDEYTLLHGINYDAGLFKLSDFDANRKTYYKLKGRNLPGVEYIRQSIIYKRYYKSLEQNQ